MAFWIKYVTLAGLALHATFAFTADAAGHSPMEDALLRTGVEQLAPGDVEALEAILAERPDDLRIIRNVGMIYMFRARAGIDFEKNLDAAISLFQHGIATDPKDPWPRACHGICLALKADASWSPISKILLARDSMKELTRAVEIDPTLLEVRQMRAMVLREIPSLIGEPEIAVQDLEYIISKGESGESFLDEQSAAQSYLALAQILHDDKKRARAAELLHQTLLVGPGSPEAAAASHLLNEWGLHRPDTPRQLPVHHWRCTLEPEKTFAPLKARVDASPDDPKALADLASAHICGGLGDPEDGEAARRLMERARALAPEDPFVRTLHGAMLAFVTKFAWYPVERLTLVNLGVEEMTSAIDSVPAEQEERLATLRRHRGMGGATVPESVFRLNALGREDLDYVWTVARKHPGLFLPHDTAEFTLKRGELYLQSGEKEEARKCFRELLAVAPESCQAVLARTYLKRLP